MDLGAVKQSTMKPICYIVGAGENYGLDFQKNDGDYVIAADGGLVYLHERGIMADLLIGDFDSLGEKPYYANIIPLEGEKDDTDMLAAVREGMARGYDFFYIYCGTGGRFEHTLANIQTLGFLAQSGKRGFLIEQNSIITVISDGSICFDSSYAGYVSVFSYSETATGVSIKGLKYELENHVLTNIFPVGTSNEFIGATSTISVTGGALLIVFPRRGKFCIKAQKSL